MARSNSDLLAIKSELTNDPLMLGLDANPAHDEANANALNLVRVTIQIKKRSLSTANLFNAIDPIEHQALSDQQARWLSAVLALGTIDPFTATVIRSGLDSLFSNESTSRATYSAAMLESGSRINDLFQAGTLQLGGTVTPSDIAEARAAS